MPYLAIRPGVENGPTTIGDKHWRGRLIIAELEASQCKDPYCRQFQGYMTSRSVLKVLNVFQRHGYKLVSQSGSGIDINHIHIWTLHRDQLYTMSLIVITLSCIFDQHSLCTLFGYQQHSIVHSCWLFKLEQIFLHSRVVCHRQFSAEKF